MNSNLNTKNNNLKKVKGINYMNPYIINVFMKKQKIHILII